MKVLHVSEACVGGVATYFEEMIPAQVSAMGKENVILLVRSSFSHNVKNFNLATLYTYRSEGRDVISLFRMLHTYRLLLYTYHPEIVHLHSTLAGWVIRAYHALSRRKSPKIVYCAHGWSFHIAGGRAQRCLSVFIERFLARHCDMIINISNFEQDSALDIGIPKEKLKMIYNGISSMQNNQDSIEFRFPNQKYGINLLFIGRLDPQKGFDILESAMREVSRKDVKLHVIGATVMSSSFYNINENCESAIHFHGWLPREEVLSYINRCNAVVMPSRWEGFGLVAIEAMRSGKAVIASDVGALPEIVLDGETGYLFRSGNADQLRGIIEGLTINKLKKMGDSGRAKFLEKFTSANFNKCILKCYRELLGLPPETA